MFTYKPSILHIKQQSQSRECTTFGIGCLLKIKRLKRVLPAECFKKENWIRLLKVPHTAVFHLGGIIFQLLYAHHAENEFS